MRISDATRFWAKGLDDSDVSARLVAWARQVDTVTSIRQLEILESYALYGSTSLLLSGGVERVLGADQLGKNWLASAADTLLSDITQNDTIPQVSCVDADWETQRRAKKLDAHIGLQFSDAGASTATRRAARDAIIAGEGFARAYPDGDEVAYERIHPLSVLVDDRACIDVEPRELVIRRALSRDHAMALYPEQAQAIESAPRPTSTYWTGLDASCDFIELLEAWHLPSSPGADDGVHVLAIDCVPALLVEPWAESRFPVAMIAAVDPTRGVWGESLVQRAAPAQAHCNKLDRRIQESMHRIAVPRIFCQTGSVNKAQLTNEVGIIVDVNGTPPTFAVAPSMHGDVFQQAHQDRQDVFALMGVSEMSANSQKPAGLNSGRALRSFHEFQSRRYKNFEKALERASCVLAEDTLRLQGEIAEHLRAEGKTHTVNVGGESIRAEEWSAIEIDRAKLRVRVLPASSLSRSLSGRLEELQELLAAGAIDQTTFIRSAGITDLESIKSELTAGEDAIRRKLEAILDGKPYEQNVPEPYEDLARARKLCVLCIQQAENADAPEARVDELRRWLGDIEALQQRMAEKLAPEMGAATGAAAANAAGGVQTSPVPLDALMSPGGPGFPGGALPPAMPGAVPPGPLGPIPPPLG